MFFRDRRKGTYCKKSWRPQCTARRIVVRVKIPDSLRGRVAHPLRGLQRVGILVLAFFPENLNTYKASGGIEIKNSKAPPFVRGGQRMGHPKTFLVRHLWATLTKSPEHGTWLYIYHRRRYFAIHESHKLGVHEQSAGLRADLWLRVSAVLFGSSEFNRRVGKLARSQAANGCRSGRSSPVCFRRLLAHCGRSHPNLGLIVPSGRSCVCSRCED